MQLLPRLSSGFVSPQGIQHSNHPILSRPLQHPCVVCNLLPILLARKLRLREVKLAKELGMWTRHLTLTPETGTGRLGSTPLIPQISKAVVYGKRLEWRWGDSNFLVTLTSVASFPPLLTPPRHLYEPHIRPPDTEVPLSSSFRHSTSKLEWSETRLVTSLSCALPFWDPQEGTGDAPPSAPCTLPPLLPTDLHAKPGSLPVSAVPANPPPAPPSNIGSAVLTHRFTLTAKPGPNLTSLVALLAYQPDGSGSHCLKSYHTFYWYLELGFAPCLVLFEIRWLNIHKGKHYFS